MSGLPTLEIQETLLHDWEFCFEQFGLKLIEGLGHLKFPRQTTKNRLFHADDNHGTELLWFDIQPPQRNPLDQQEYSLMRYLHAPGQAGSQKQRQFLAASQVETFLLASGARRLETKMTQRFILRCSSIHIKSLPALLNSFTDQMMKVVLSDGRDLLEPFAVMRHGSKCVSLFAGRLIKPIDGFEHYVSIVPQKTWFGSSRHSAQASELLMRLMGSDPAHARQVANDEFTFEVE